MNNQFKYLKYGVFVFLFIYLFLRTIYVPLSHDEIATYFLYIQQGEFLPFYAHMDANNHVLNSLLGWISESTFGYSSFSIRLPNLLSFIVFCLFSFKMSSLINDKYLSLFLFLGLVGCNGYIDFFGLARGYGMSQSFFIPTLYYILKYNQQKNFKYIIYGNLFSILALIGSFSMLNIHLLTSLTLLILYVLNHRKLKSYFLIPLSFTINLIATSLTIFTLFEYKKMGLLYYGNLEGFWDTTIISLVKVIFLSNSILFHVFTVLIIAYTFLLFIYKIWIEKWSAIGKSYFFPTSILITSYIMVEILAKILHVNYPEDRVGFYFYPLLITSLLFLLDSFNIKSLKLIGIVFIFFLNINLIANLSFHQTNNWREDHVPEHFYSIIAEHYTNDYPPIISGRMRYFTFGEKIYRNKTKLNQIKGSDYPKDTTADFVISNYKDKHHFLHLYDSLSWSTISKVILFKRKKTLKRNLIHSFKIEPFSLENQEFHNLVQLKIDSIKSNFIEVGVDLELNYDNVKPLNVWVVSDISDYIQKENLEYEPFILNYIHRIWNNTPIKNSTKLKLHPQNNQELTIYLWLKKKQSLDILKARIDIFELTE